MSYDPDYYDSFDIAEELAFLLEDREFKTACDEAGVYAINLDGGLRTEAKNREALWWVCIELEFNTDLWDWNMGREVFVETAQSHLRRIRSVIESKPLRIEGLPQIIQRESGTKIYAFDGLEPVPAAEAIRA